jgi:hypothetical protein
MARLADVLISWKCPSCSQKRGNYPIDYIQKHTEGHAVERAKEAQRQRDRAAERQVANEASRGKAARKRASKTKKYSN